MKTNTHTRYQVSYNGFYGYFSPKGYSKYYPSRVYGYEQALEHIEELKVDSPSTQNVKWQIEIITVVETIITL